MDTIYFGDHCTACLPAMAPPTLAAKLGTTTHLSSLLRKAERLGLDAEGLERLALQRGCDYYNPGEPLPSAEVSLDQFSNVELAVALLNPARAMTPGRCDWVPLCSAQKAIAPSRSPGSLSWSGLKRWCVISLRLDIRRDLSP